MYIKIWMFVVLGLGVVVSGCGSTIPTPEKSQQSEIHTYAIDTSSVAVDIKKIIQVFQADDFTLTLHSDIQYSLKKKFQDTNFKVYSTLSFYPNASFALALEKNPKLGLVLPFSLAIYQRTSEKNLYISFLSADAQAEIIEHKDALLKQTEERIHTLLRAMFPNAIYGMNSVALGENAKRITSHKIHIPHTLKNDIAQAQEELESDFEDSFECEGYFMPSYYDFADLLADASPYDIYAHYAICKMDVIRDVARLYPQAAVFAPCTSIMYKKKGDNTIHMSFVNVYNWIQGAAIQDEATRSTLLETQKNFETLLKELDF